MKKVCIVTNYSGTANYGAILQAYSLNAFIRSQGCICQTLNYYASRSNKRQIIQDHIRHPSVIITLIWSKAQRQLAIKTYRMRSMVFDRFRDECIPHTKECGKQNAKEVVKEFDVLICGSDQIWRPSLQTGEFDDVMWLNPFPNTFPKFSYAASLGITELDEGKVSYIRDALSGFRAISVREESAKRLLEKICGREVQVVLDPVFLMSRDYWRNFANYRYRNKKYIFCYFIQPQYRIYRRIEEFARAINMEIIYMPYMGYKFNWPDFMLHGKKEAVATPQEFVGYIDAAAYVFTDSFHATAFSIMLHKNVHVFITNYGTRLQNLLKLAGMEDFIENDSNNILVRDIADMDWAAVDEKLRTAAKASVNYINQAIWKTET